MGVELLLDAAVIQFSGLPQHINVCIIQSLMPVQDTVVNSPCAQAAAKHKQHRFVAGYPEEARSLRPFHMGDDRLLREPDFL